MAKIIEENIVIKISKIVKDNAEEGVTLIDDEVIQTLETVVSEIAGNNAVVEVVVA